MVGMAAFVAGLTGEASTAAYYLGGLVAAAPRLAGAVDWM